MPRQMMTDHPTGRRATLIESLGVYLPPKEVLTEDLMRGCVVNLGFPLERMSGIKSRHVAGDTEFSIDLAERAIVRCLERSKYGPGDVELLIIASVARSDGPGLWVSHEPSTALRLRHRLGLERAIVFDIASACSGMFTGLVVADALIRRGVIQRGIVASGEYISHLGITAQKEITEVLDQRLACLTLGDAGAAVMLEGTDAPDRGFDALDLSTFGAYASYCVAYPTREPHGGAIMLTDALKLTDAATRHGAAHALQTLQGAGWSAESFQHLIMHQTSSTALTSAMREINRVVGTRVCHPGNTIDNLARRGNTASTSHFVALGDSLAAGRIRTGDRVIFAISGSGLTVGTALYTFDDLPDRFASPPGVKTTPSVRQEARPRPDGPLVRIESIGIASGAATGRGETFDLLRQAATDCLAHSCFDRGDIALLIFAGVYRTAYLTEPAIAALLAGELDINATLSESDPRRTLAFDISNGAVGFLNACHVATEMIRAGRVTAAMVVTSEVENNAESFPAEMLGIEETGSAVILTLAAGPPAGFGSFCFRAFTERAMALATHCINRDATVCLVVTRDPDLERQYVAAIAATVTGFLAGEGIELGRIARVLPPQISPEFISSLSAALGVPREQFVDVTGGRRDLFTSSVPFAFRSLGELGLMTSGDIGLVVTVGSGIQVGCALYYF
jgi:3-oxoacyl-[acyl-carrier-protein] synthase III